MAITNFIPTIWSETLYSELNKHFVAVNHCNRDFEGDIKSKGSVVNICGVGDITIKDYTANTDMSTPQELEDSVTKLEIKRLQRLLQTKLTATYFHFTIMPVKSLLKQPVIQPLFLIKYLKRVNSFTKTT